MDTENSRYEPRAMGGSVKRSLAMAIPKAFGFEAATQQNTSEACPERRAAASSEAWRWPSPKPLALRLPLNKIRAKPAPSGVEGSGGFTRRRFGGFTLAEAMMATVVLGIAAAGVLLPFASGAKVRAEGLRRTLAANLASDLMEEIISTEFSQIIPMYGTYPEEDLSSTYAKFSRGASCAWDETQDFFILVTVWVKYNGREIAVINRLIAK
jgi:hypothetical protein